MPPSALCQVFGDLWMKNMSQKVEGPVVIYYRSGGHLVSRLVWEIALTGEMKWTRNSESASADSSVKFGTALMPCVCSQNKALDHDLHGFMRTRPAVSFPKTFLMRSMIVLVLNSPYGHVAHLYWESKDAWIVRKDRRW